MAKVNKTNDVVPDELYPARLMMGMLVLTFFMWFILCLIIATSKAILTVMWVDFGYNFNSLIIMKLDNATLFAYIGLLSGFVSTVLGFLIYYKGKQKKY